MRKNLKLAARFTIDLMLLDLFHAAGRGLWNHLKRLRSDGAA